MFGKKILGILLKILLEIKFFYPFWAAKSKKKKSAWIKTRNFWNPAQFLNVYKQNYFLVYLSKFYHWEQKTKD